MVGDFLCRVAILDSGAMQKPVVGLPTGPCPDLLGACFIGLARLALRVALLRLVGTGPLQAQRASLDPLDFGGPFLGRLRSKYVARA